MSFHTAQSPLPGGERARERGARATVFVPAKAGTSWIPSLLAALLLPLCLTPARGQAEAPEADPRDAFFFGEASEEEDEAPAADPRDEAIFGSDDERDSAIFGGDARDQAIFGGGDERDDLFFGGDDDGLLPASAPSDQPVFPDEERDEGRLLPTDEIERRLGFAENRLDMGGLLYLRMQYGAQTEGNPETFPIGSPNLLDLYLDARPNDRLRAFARGRLTHYLQDAPPPEADLPGGAPGGTHAALDQLWLKFDVDHQLYVTAGRQPIRWGTGRFWNPTDFLNIQRRDPLAVFDERLGVNLLKLHYPLEGSGWNFYAIANLEGISRPDEIGGAFRMEKLIGTTEVALSAALRKDQPILLGADLSFPVGLFDFRAEAAFSRGQERPFWRGPISLDLQDPRIPTAFSREDEWIPQVVLGAEVAIPYGDDDSISVGVEYFYNDAGTSESELYPWLLFTGDFTPLYLGRHYGGVYAAAVGPGNWNDTTLIASLLGNLSDGSFLSRFDWRVRLLTYLDLNAWAALHFGTNGEFHFGLDVPPTEIPDGLPERDLLPPGLEGALERGISIPAPLLDVGLGLSLRF